MNDHRPSGSPATARRVLFALIVAVLTTPCTPAQDAPTADRDVTFIVTSDAHYDAFENEDRNERVRDTIREMNAVTNLSWPDELGGGAVDRPHGVLVLGDVIDDGDRVFQGKFQTRRQYLLFEADFGLDGTDGLLNYPVFETWGNHDGPPVGKEKSGFSFQAQLQRRNALREQKGWLTSVSSNGLFYSWDWAGVHFVMAGIYAADTANQPWQKYSPVWHNPQGALSFLKEDLSRYVGASGRPVVVLTHCGFDTDWWHANEWRAAYDVLRPYRTLAWLYGHTGTGLRQWAPPGETNLIQCVNTGQTEKGFFLAHLSRERMRLAYRMKNWRQEKTPEGRPRIIWDGAWEWKHLLSVPLGVVSPKGDRGPKTDLGLSGSN